MCYRHEAHLVQSAKAPSEARGIIRRMCREFHVEELTDTATLLTSELVTNAVQYAPGPMQLGVSCTHGQFLVSVQDTNPEPPRVRRSLTRSIGGRGLALVAKLSERWGFRQHPHDGKSVWFTLSPDQPPVGENACTCPAVSLDASGSDLAEVVDVRGPKIPTSRNPQ